MLAFPTISAMDNKASIANRPDLLAIWQGKYIVQTSRNFRQALKCIFFDWIEKFI